MSKQYIVGLTGGIGSGKSTVADAFKQLGVRVIDADQASRAVVEPESEALNKIEAYFQPIAGEIPIIVEGKLNRSALRTIIFNNADKKNWLEELLHPLISQWIDHQIVQTTKSPYIILESPLLFETEQYKKVNTSLLIDIPPELQIQRAARRDGASSEQIQAIINTQMSRQQKMELAEYIFDNSLGIESVDKRVLDLHRQFESLAKSK
ncbi:MAG: dephospho-CoA kinase [Porticoccaceae bacterium]|nr:dephospho-CoA kinase [Porticoccaceae bacterium]